MRHKLTRQMDIFHSMGKNEIAKELQAMSEILDANPSMLDKVFKTLPETPGLIQEGPA